MQRNLPNQAANHPDMMTSLVHAIEKGLNCRTVATTPIHFLTEPAPKLRLGLCQLPCHEIVHRRGSHPFHLCQLCTSGDPLSRGHGIVPHQYHLLACVGEWLSSGESKPGDPLYPDLIESRHRPVLRPLVELP
jgi:hypothetical protein